MKATQTKRKPKLFLVSISSARCCCWPLLADLLPALKQAPPHLGRMRQVPLGLAGSLPPSAAKGPGRARLPSTQSPAAAGAAGLPRAWGAACPAAPTGAARCCRVLCAGRRRLPGSSGRSGVQKQNTRHQHNETWRPRSTKEIHEIQSKSKGRRAQESRASIPLESQYKSSTVHEEFSKPREEDEGGRKNQKPEGEVDLRDRGTGRWRRI